MTDKQIKDGIDVSQCEYYSIKHNSCNHTISGSCIKENCQIFRLLQTIRAKEQECERLEYEVGSLENDRDILHDKSDQLKAQLLDQEAETLKAGGIIETLTKENEQLKKQACGLRPELKYIIDKTCCKYHINAKYYHEKIVEIINNLDKYTQTLTEIKEIGKKSMREGKMLSGGWLYQFIEQKISEVLDVENN